MLAIAMRVGARVGLRPPLPEPHSGLFAPLLEKFPRNHYLVPEEMPSLFL
jgi:hypothetical protein